MDVYGVCGMLLLKTWIHGHPHTGAAKSEPQTGAAKLEPLNGAAKLEPLNGAAKPIYSDPRSLKTWRR